MEDNRYEEVPQKENGFVKIMKILGNYFKNVFFGFVDSFKYNNMKLAALLVAVPGLAIGFFLVFHADVINQMDFTFEFFNEEYFMFDKYTYPQMPIDVTGIALFLIMLFGILNVFNALSMSSKKNLGSVVVSTVFTVVMVILSAYYVYAVLFYNSIAYESQAAVQEAINSGVQPGAYVGGEINQYIYKVNSALPEFKNSYIQSVLSIIICDVLSIVGVVLGFINYDRTYEKVDR